MSFYQFSKLIISHQENSTKPRENEYPKEITLNSNVWQEILRLYSFTQPYNYEYSTSLFSVDNDIVATPPIKGTKVSVTSHADIKLKYKRVSEKFVEKQIYIDGKLKKRYQIKINSIPKKSHIIPLFTIHSHPATKGGNQKQYNFFSDTDINSLLTSKFLCIGLITNRLHLACKHKTSPSKLSDVQKQTLGSLNQSYFNNQPLSVNDINDLQLVIYEARFNKRLSRSN